jgi:chorismate dehydratase
MKQQPVKISCVSYLNSVPFRYGLTHHPVKERIQLLFDTPADSAIRLQRRTADIGLIPVAAISSVKNARIISNWCIGADGPVKSVTLLSRVPLREIKHILLDYQSRTSVRLIQILASEYWKIGPAWVIALPGFETELNGDVAGLVIGDRSLKIRDQFEYVYDLSQEWKTFTGLPFVFACWVANRDLEPTFLKEFEDALKFGIDNIDKVINTLQGKPGYYKDTPDYLQKFLSYSLDEQKKAGMELFLKYASAYEPKEINR